MLMFFTKHIKICFIRIKLIKNKLNQTLLFSSILLIGSISAGSADTEFEEYFLLSPPVSKLIANRITTYYSEDITSPPELQKKELLKFQKTLELEKNKQKKRSAYWFIKGLNHRNLAALYSELKEPSLADIQTSRKNIAYKNALELDSKTPHKLSAVIYSTMKYGLPQDLKITATQGEISQGGKGDNDSYYWYLHWSNIDQLQKAGREDEAKEAYKKMQNELKNSDMDMSVYKTMNKQIETKTLKLERKKTTTKPEKKKKKPEKKGTASKSTLDKKYIIIYIISTLSILALVIVTVIEIKKKRN